MERISFQYLITELKYEIIDAYCRTPHLQRSVVRVEHCVKDTADSRVSRYVRAASILGKEIWSIVRYAVDYLSEC